MNPIELAVLRDDPALEQAREAGRAEAARATEQGFPAIIELQVAA